MHLSDLYPFLVWGPSGLVTQFSSSEPDSPDEIGLDDVIGWGGKYGDVRPNQWYPELENSIYCNITKDPDGLSALHVHKNGAYGGIGRHALQRLVPSRQTIYIAYTVRPEEVDDGTSIWQWFNNDVKSLRNDPFPASLTFHNDTGVNASHAHTLHLEAQPNPKKSSTRKSVWSHKLEMGKHYKFGMVINTHEMDGYIHFYVNGQQMNLTDPVSGHVSHRLAGNFWPGPRWSTDPKFGLYGGELGVDCDLYIYNVLIAVKPEEMAAMAGIDLALLPPPTAR